MTSGHPENYTSLTDATPRRERGECAASAASPSPCRRDQHWLIVVEGQAGRGVVCGGGRRVAQDAVLAGGVAVHGVDEFAISLRRGASPAQDECRHGEDEHRRDDQPQRLDPVRQ